MKKELFGKPANVMETAVSYVLINDLFRSLVYIYLETKKYMLSMCFIYNIAKLAKLNFLMINDYIRLNNYMLEVKIGDKG